MENSWNLFNNGYSGGGGGGGGGRGGQNDSTCSNVAWDIWELGTTSLHQVNASTGVLSGTATTNTDATTTTDAACRTRIEASEVHALMFPHNKENTGDASLYAGGRSYYHPDPHLMCLKLGKRHYFEDSTPTVDRPTGAAGFKRGKPYLYSGVGGGGLVGGQSSSEVVTVAVPATMPRCQVEGCHVALVNAKEYHRRHKVCEMHSKAPKVVVLGLEQRFCQQCSRFHAVSEFDESKRSCRRRLAGHNERRRKSSHLDHPFPTRNPSQDNTTMKYTCDNSTGRQILAYGRARKGFEQCDRDACMRIELEALGEHLQRTIASQVELIFNRLDDLEVGSRLAVQRKVDVFAEELDDLIDERVAHFTKWEV
ncbi:hypothetical protein RJ639_042217 [Escallonia herrerae]|uniref:SBP-type domain-containing protein n=1 Tax=Escallonia herrerae TaxID=1293975 RepID=A0AA88WUL6_9ASTE|nr:hypothetical protein RJ639_042217 [Escallonia herrerae]